MDILGLTACLENLSLDCEPMVLVDTSPIDTGSSLWLDMVSFIHVYVLLGLAGLVLSTLSISMASVLSVFDLGLYTQPLRKLAECLGALADICECLFVAMFWLGATFLMWFGVYYLISLLV